MLEPLTVGTDSSSSLGKWDTTTREDSISPAEYERNSLKLGAQAAQWPTARASEGEHGGPNGRDSAGSLHLAAAAKWPTAVASPNENRGTSDYGRTGGKHLAAAAALWPTTTTTTADSKASGAAGYSTKSGRHSGTTLTDRAVMQFPSGP